MIEKYLNEISDQKVNKIEALCRLFCRMSVGTWCSIFIVSVNRFTCIGCTPNNETPPQYISKTFPVDLQYCVDKKHTESTLITNILYETLTFIPIQNFAIVCIGDVKLLKDELVVRLKPFMSLAQMVVENIDLSMYDTTLINIINGLRTPINGVVGFSQLLSRSKTLGKQDKDYVDSLSRASTQLLKSINDIYDSTKLSVGDISITKTNFKLGALVSQIEQTVKINLNEKKISLEIRGENYETSLYTDYNRLLQVIINLVLNSTEIVPNNGEVVLDFNIFFEPENKLRVSVWDNGCGIPEGEQYKLFKSFSSINNLKYKGGLGLGLYICSKIVEMLGGKIWVAETSKHGTQIDFTLDYKEPLNTYYQREQHLKKLYIFVGTTDIDLIQFLIVVFNTWGVRPLFSDSPNTALKIIKSGKYEFDLCILDFSSDNASEDDKTTNSFFQKYNEFMNCDGPPVLKIQDTCPDQSKTLSTKCCCLIKPIECDVLKNIILNLVLPFV